jgi:GMP synthase-like glutamine amidotransferase
MAVNKEILVIKNIVREDTGLLGNIIKELGITTKVIELSLSEKIPSVERFGAVVVLGGPDSANDETPGMKNELTFIRKVLEAEIPYLGICLGFQTMVKAAGGKVVKSPSAEIGFRDSNDQLFNVKLTESGRKDPLFEGIEDSFNVFHLHGETVILTEKMKLLATGNICPNQIVRTGKNAYGIQCHFELTGEMFEEWINKDPDLLLLDKVKLRSDFASVKAVDMKRGYMLFSNFLRIAGFNIQPLVESH